MSHEAIEVDGLKRWKTYAPDKPALIHYAEGKTYTYSQMYSVACELATYLQSKGIGHGDRVAVLAHNRIETIMMFFALQRLGAILVPLNFRLSPPELDYILQDCAPQCLFYDEALMPTVESLKYEGERENYSTCVSSLILQSCEVQKDAGFACGFEDPCLILYTSGTTGFPKGAVLTPKMMFWNSINTSLSLNIESNDRTVNFAPLFHTGGWNVLMTPFFHRGATVIFFEKFEATKILEICAQEKVTLLFGVPTMLAMMAEAEIFQATDLSSLRYVIVGGEPMPLGLIQTWNEKGVPVRQGYGLTEFGPNCFSLSEKDAQSRMGSIGRPNFYVQTQVVDDRGQEVACGEVGELWLKGPSCMKGYWNNEKATQETMDSGWLKTGDLVRKDEDDYFYVVGRKKDMFISGGENVYPVEVEKVLQSHPHIAEAAVIGTADEKWGEVGKAFIVCKESALDEQSLKDFCRAELAGYKVPKHFVFLSELPKGDSGKIQKRILKEMSL